MDILITSTAAPGFVVTKANSPPSCADAADRPLFVIDIAVPRDVEPAANDVEGVYLYDIDSLQEIARQAMDARRQETDACERIIRGPRGGIRRMGRASHRTGDHALRFRGPAAPFFR